MRWVIDEMLPRTVAEELNELGHDGISVHDVGLRARPDEEIFDFAVREERIIVTENFSDYARLLEYRLALGDNCTPVVFVKRAMFPRSGALAKHIAVRLNHWSKQNPVPYIGFHWPSIAIPLQPSEGL